MSKEEGISTEELPPSDFPMDMSVGIFLINDSCERSQPTVVDIAFEQMVLDCLKCSLYEQALNMPRHSLLVFFSF